MAKGIHAGVGDVAKKVKQLYIGVDDVARKITKAYVGVDGVARQVWPSYTWQRYSVDTLTTYFWDQYSVSSTTQYTGNVNISYASGSMTVTWSPTYSRYDPPRIDGNNWDNCVGGTWNGWDPPGDWVCRSVRLNYPMYYVTAIEDASGSAVKISYSKMATAATRTVYSQGTTSYGQVSSANSGAYPSNGKSGSYWYVYNKSTSQSVKGSLVDTITGDTPDQYPADGIHTDGYWYVRVVA